MRIVCISDTHNQHSSMAERLPDGDVLIISGDITMGGTEYELKIFNDYVKTLPHQHKLLVAGNHDWALQEADDPGFFELMENVTYLEDTGVEIDRVKFWGSPWQPEFYNWAFNLPRGRQLADIWAQIPGDTDVLITHSPPYGILDRIDTGEHVGCEDLETALLRVKPKLHVFGHIHEDYGILTKNGTTFVNASLCDGRYQPINAPVVIDL